MKHVLDAAEPIPALLDEINVKLDQTAEDLRHASPSQQVELAAACITALAHASHRSRDTSIGDAVRSAVMQLMDEVRAQIEHTDPSDCIALVKACAGIEFQVIANLAVEQARNQPTD